MILLALSNAIVDTPMASIVFISVVAGLGGLFHLSPRGKTIELAMKYFGEVTSKATWEYVLTSLILSAMFNVASGVPIFEWPPSVRTIAICFLGNGIMLRVIFKRDSEDTMKSLFMKETRCQQMKKHLTQIFCESLEYDLFAKYNVSMSLRSTCTGKKKGKKTRNSAPDAFIIYDSIFDKTEESFVDKILRASDEYDDSTKSHFEALVCLFEKIVESNLARAVAYTRKARTVRSSSPPSMSRLEEDLTIESYRGGWKLRKLLKLLVGSDAPKSKLYSLVSFTSDEARICVAKTMPSMLKKKIRPGLLEEAFEEVRRSRKSKRLGKLRLWNAVRPEVPAYVFGMSILATAWVAGPLVWHGLIYIFDDVHTGRKTLDQVRSTLCGTVLAALFTWLFDQSGWFLIERAQSRVHDRLKKSLMAHTLGLDQEYFDRHKTGHMQRRINVDTREAAQQMIHMPREFFWAVAHGIVSHSIIIYNVSPRLLAVVLVPIPFVALLQYYLVQRRYAWDQRARKYRQVASFKANEVLNKMHLVRSFVREGEESASFAAQGAFVRSVDLAAHAFTHFGCMFPFIISMLLCRCFIVFDAAKFVRDREITVAQGVLTLQVVEGVMSGVRRFFELVPNALKAIGPITRIATILEHGSKIERHSFSKTRDSDPSVAAGKERADMSAGAPKGSIEFCNVHFAYPGQTPSRLVLKGLSFEAKCGERVALVGCSGSGKSTCVKLLSRLYDPQIGDIRLNGKSLKDYDVHTLRRSIATVAQENEVFSTTIRDNLLYGIPRNQRKSVTTEKIKEACQLAGAWDAFIDNFPHKLETYVGEGGKMLSGGQRQRLAIARAILSRPKILLLDEATSALDNALERTVKKGIDSLLKNRSRGIVLAIAHRLTTIRDYDKIVVLHDGRVAEHGTHEELLRIPIEKNAAGKIVRGLYRHQWNESLSE